MAALNRLSVKQRRRRDTDLFGSATGLWPGGLGISHVCFRVLLINNQLITTRIILSEQKNPTNIPNTIKSPHIHSYLHHGNSSFSFSVNSQPPFPLPQQHRNDSQSNSHTHNSSLNTKNQSDPIALNPCRLEVSHCEPATGAPHIQNG